MTSFTKKLILYCTGITFASFFMVYFLFNVLVSGYIRAEAERELSGGMLDVASLIAMPLYNFMFTDDMPHLVQEGRFEIMVRASNEPIRANHNQHARIQIFPGHFANPFFSNIAREFTLPAEDSILFVEGMLPLSQLTMESIYSLRPVRQHSMMTTNAIILAPDGQIISPRAEQLTEHEMSEVEFLANYYLTNQGRFNSEDMVMVTGGASSYYVSVTRYNTASANINNRVSIIMYTDISPAVDFTTGMNRILGLLLLISGLISLTISIIMSARFKRAIVRLCNYADAIGRGNWDARAGNFNDLEFNQLSKSMDNMSDKLQAYENNQRQFFQNVSHELRTPLMSIQGYAEGLMVDIFEKEEAAGIILSEGQKMADLVAELLYVSRIDSNQEAPTSLINVQEMLLECYESIKPIAKKEGKEILLDRFDNEDTENESNECAREFFVEANEEKLSRVIINILSNAIRYAKAKVSIKCHSDNSKISIVISDDGSGINPADIQHIFERFYKGEDGNYGLGLAICRDIIMRLDGDITAENSINEGAVFTITLPDIIIT